MGVPGTDSNFYARWREEHDAPLFLEERDGAHPPERLLQSIWLHQRLRREQLQTLDGRSLRVLHPGFWNRAAGPDFHGAVLQFGQEPARTGDVEIDWVGGNWRAHGHQGNPAFAGVILHVIWNGARPETHPLPALALEKFIDTPLGEIQQWAGTGEARDWPTGPAERHARGQPTGAHKGCGYDSGAGACVCDRACACAGMFAPPATG